MPRIPTPFRQRTPPEPPPSDTPEAEEEGHELRMSLLEHLVELRNRLMWAFIAVIVGTTIGFFFTGEVLNVIRGPYCEVVGSPEDCRLVVLGPTGNIIAYFRVALMLGGVIAVPVITYHLLMFVTPGLTRREKRIVLLSLPAITLLFLVGSGFAWLVLMRPALGFLEGFQPMIFQPEWTADLYLGFVTSLVFWMGVAFETPLAFFVLSLLGLIQASTLLSNWRIAIIAAAAAAAMITPTIDPVNMFLVMGPLLGLYALSIILVMIGSRISRRRLEAGSR